MPLHQRPALGPFTYSTPRANIATHPSPSVYEWIIDSSASHHINANLNNIFLHYPYSGHDDVLIGDDNGLSISHICSLILPASSNSLTLDNVLCVPAMKSNLISMSQPCSTNHVYVTLLPNAFQVRDLRTRDLEHQGPIKDGVYVWSTSLQPGTPLLAFSSVKAYAPIWHSCLGHLSNKLVSHLAVYNQILISS